MNHLVLNALVASATSSSDTSENLTDAVDAVDKLSGTISEYGLAVVIMAVFFIIFLLLVFLILRSNSKMMAHVLKHQNRTDNFEEELLSKFVDTALEAKLGGTGGLSDKIANEVKQAVAPIQQSVDSINTAQSEEDAIHKDLVGAYIDVNMAFKDASRSALANLNCARVAIYVFHNGNKSMHGLPFFKMSCIHEWTNMGSNTLRGKSHIEMPLHLFADFIEDLWKNGVYKSENVAKSVENDISLNEFVAYSKTKALYINAIKDDNDVIAGFVVAEFENEDTFETDESRDREVKQVLDKMVMKVAPILTYHHISNKK